MLIRSALLDDAGFDHGFSTRDGGVSEGPFATLNLARTVGDDEAAVEENVRRFAQAVGCPARRLFEVSQVHGRTVVAVHADDRVSAVRTMGADALVTDWAGAGVAVRTADCVPILLADPETGAVAAVHAGWRGVVAGILDEAIDRLGVPPARLLAAIGPHIRAFEVGEDVALQIAEAARGADVITARRPRPHAHLARAVDAQLRYRGLESIDDVGGCTLSEPERFFSHRRDEGTTGRHLALIVAR